MAYRSLIAGRMVSVRPKTCGDTTIWHWVYGTSDLSAGEAIEFAREIFHAQPGCEHVRADEALAGGDCRDIHFLAQSPDVYHFANVCPGTREAQRPTEELCGSIRLLGEDKASERCVEAFADQ